MPKGFVELKIKRKTMYRITKQVFYLLSQRSVKDFGMIVCRSIYG